MDDTELREIFDHYDRDHNGTIDHAEFAALCHALDPEMTAEIVDVGLAEVDADGNGTVEFDEFAAWWTER